MRLKSVALAVVLLACSPLVLCAQMGTTASGTAVGTHLAPSKALDDMITLFEGELVPAVKAMPADKFDFAPTKETFAPGSPAEFATVRTFSQQVAHLAQANYFFFGSASGIKPDTDVKAIGSMKSKDELIAALEKSFAFAHKAALAITEANAFETVKPVDGQRTRFSIAAFAIAHANDHYGQLVEYLRMNGIIPPASVKK